MNKVDLITGFLGAGKTTLIRRYLSHLDSLGISYAVIENEFGASGVDSAILGESARELSGGCICCGQKVSFHNLILELAQEVDRIIVEPSGIFNADDFFDIMNSPKVREVCKYGFMAGVVDPGSLPRMSGTDRRILVSELGCAGAVLVSHTDRLGENAVNEAKAFLAGLLSDLPPVMDAHEIDFDFLMTCAPVFHPHKRDASDHSALYQSAAVRVKGVYDEDSVRRICRRLFSGEAGEALRVKGLMQGESAPLLINAVPGEVQILPGEGEFLLNVIGRNLNRSAIRSILDEERLPCAKEAD